MLHFITACPKGYVAKCHAQLWRFKESVSCFTPPRPPVIKRKPDASATGALDFVRSTTHVLSVQFMSSRTEVFSSPTSSLLLSMPDFRTSSGSPHRVGADTQASPAQLFSRSQLLVALLFYNDTANTEIYTLSPHFTPCG